MNQRTAIFGLDHDEIRNYSNGEWDFHKEDTQEHLHALHPYPARFIPQIPRKAIELWTSEGDLVLDPFCGCGTTLLESILLGRPAIGVDNNGVACLVSKAKTAHYSSQDLKVLNRFRITLKDSIDNPKLQISLPEYENVDYWFSQEAILDMGKLKAVIQDLPNRAKLFADAVFSSVIVRASNQDSDTRYARIEREYKPRSVINWFITKLSSSLSRLQEIIDLPKSKAKVFCQDGRNLGNVPAETVKLIITSPPYINAYDYHKYHRHRLHWIDADVSFARDHEIGKHDTFTRPNATPHRYFEDMLKCFEQWHRVLCRKGHVFVVTGDGIVSGEPVTVGEEFISLCEKVGFTFRKRWIRKLKAKSKSFNQKARINEEHLLLFVKK